MRVAFWVSILVPMAWASPWIPLEPVELDGDGMAHAIPGIAFITIPQESTHSPTEPMSPEHDGYDSTIPNGHVKREEGENVRENSNQLLLKGNSPAQRYWSFTDFCGKQYGWSWGCDRYKPVCCEGDYCCPKTFSKCCEGDKCCNICEGNRYCPSTHFCCPKVCCPKGKVCCGDGLCCHFNLPRDCPSNQFLCPNADICCPKGKNCCGNKCCDFNLPTICPSNEFLCPNANICCPKGKTCCGNKCCSFWGK